MGSFATQQFLLTSSASVDAVALTVTAALDPFEPALDLAMFDAPFQPQRTDFDWISRDTAIVDEYVADPTCGFGVDQAGARDMFAGARAAP
jgi:alpha-beta hydrolase superfamily lysophospholipase